MSFFPVQVQPFSLAGAGVTIGDSQMVLSSFKQIDGITNLTMADFGSIGFGTVEPGNGVQEEQISFSGVTQNTNGTATLTGIKTVTFITPYTQTANFAKTHAGGTVFVISNTSGFYSEFPILPDSATVTGVYTFTAPNYPQIDNAAIPPTLNAQFATKKYVDDIAIAGAPNATTGVKGIVQLATPAQTAAGIAVGSTGASLVPQNGTFNATSSATVLVPVTDASGKLSAGFGGNASTLATLNGSSKVVQNPASASAVAAVSSIPLSDAITNKIDTGYINTGTGANQILQISATGNFPVTVSGVNKISTVTTPVSYSNNASERTLVSVSIPAGTLGTSNEVSAVLDFSRLNISSSVSGGAITFRFKYGATTLISTTYTNPLNADITMVGSLRFSLFGNAVTNAQIGESVLSFVKGGLLITTGSNQAILTDTQTGTSAEDSTAAKTFAITAQYSGATASMALTMDVASIQRIA